MPISIVKADSKTDKKSLLKTSLLTILIPGQAQSLHDWVP